MVPTENMVITKEVLETHSLSNEEDPEDEEFFESFLNEFPDLIKEMYLNNGGNEVSRNIQRLFSGLRSHGLPIRRKGFQVTKDLFESLEPAFQQDFVKSVSGPLLEAFSEEKDPGMIIKMAPFLSNLVTSLIRFVEYPTAARILSSLNERQQQLEASKNTKARVIAESLERKLEPAVKKNPCG